MHKIHLEENSKPSREPQRRLNLAMQEVVRTEVIKLLDAGIIYPISDSKWMSPIHVVPKRAGLTIVKNKDNELVPTRIQSSWRVCTDYCRLNTANRKDHFSLPFIDQMVERLAGHEYYCFLDGYSGYNQVPVTTKDRHKAGAQKAPRKTKQTLGIVIPAFVVTTGEDGVGKQFRRRFERMLVNKKSRTASFANAREGRFAGILC
jgi:hypothetical protein